MVGLFYCILLYKKRKSMGYPSIAKAFLYPGLAECKHSCYPDAQTKICFHYTAFYWRTIWGTINLACEINI